MSLLRVSQHEVNSGPRFDIDERYKKAEQTVLKLPISALGMISVNF